MISIGKDFSETPMGREDADGPSNGGRFRTVLLVPALNQGGVVEVRIDDVEGYGSSFLEEAFGGLVREEGFSIDELKKRLEIVSDKPSFRTYKNLIWHYIEEAG